MTYLVNTAITTLQQLGPTYFQQPIKQWIGPYVIYATLDCVCRLYNTSWIPGFARDPLSRSLSPSLSRPSLPSLLFVPASYPPSLGLPGFAQDNCIPEILFKPWSLVTLKCLPLTPPPPSDGVGWGLHVLVTFSVEFFLSIFSAVREISRTFDILTPQPPPPPGTLDPPGWGG